jgi:hypothetical protein
MSPETALTTGADLLDSLVAFTTRYVVFPGTATVDAVALWVPHTYVCDHFEASPYLAINSPEKRSGKTRLLDVLEQLVARPWRVITPSEAVLYRKIEDARPTLLFDEVDAVFGPKAPSAYEGLRALLNAGHRAGTTVPRCVGDGARMRVQDFSVFCAKALAGIGELPDTVADRAVRVRLARRAPGETVARFRHREATEAAAPLRAALEEWAESVDLRGARPEVPDELNDRAADCWEPLLAIADAAGGAWPERARIAALALSLGRTDDDGSLGIRLLADCHRVFKTDSADRLSTEQLLERLVALEEAPWADLSGRTITARRLARLLHPYGIAPNVVRFGERTARGYLAEDFADTWARYLPPGRRSNRNERNAEQDSRPKPAPLSFQVTDVTENAPPRRDGGTEPAQVQARGVAPDSPTLPQTQPVGVGDLDGLALRGLRVAAPAGAASVPLLARRLDIDHAAAADVLAAMDNAAMLKPHSGGMARTLALTDEDIDRLLADPGLALSASH